MLASYILCCFAASIWLKAVPKHTLREPQLCLVFFRLVQDRIQDYFSLLHSIQDNTVFSKCCLLRREEMMIISCRIRWKALQAMTESKTQNYESKTQNHVWHHVPEWKTLIGTFSRVYFVNETTPVCFESSLDVDAYGIDFRCVSKGLRFVAKRLVSNLCTLKVPTTLGWAPIVHLPHLQVYNWNI